MLPAFPGFNVCAAAVLLTRALEISLVTALHVHAKNAAAQACLNAGPTGNSPVGVMIAHDTKMITQKTVEHMIQWKGNSIESSKNFATKSSDWAERKIGQAQLK